MRSYPAWLETYVQLVIVLVVGIWVVRVSVTHRRVVVRVPTNGTVTLAVSSFPRVIVPWRGSTVAAVNEALDLLECEPRVVNESYPCLALEDILGELTPEGRRDS